MYFDDCVQGTFKIFEGNSSEVYNLGSNEQVSINQMIEIIEEISGYKIEKNYQLDKPKGVRGRSSDNEKIKKLLNWEPSINLKTGLETTYTWIFNQIKSGENTQKFSKF